MSESWSSSPSPKRLENLSDGIRSLEALSKTAAKQAADILENFEKDPLDPDFLKTLQNFIGSCKKHNLSPHHLLKVPLDNDPYEFYVKEISKIRTELWNALPGYAKTALIEAHKKIDPSNVEKTRKFERVMIGLCRAYQKDSKIFSEKNVREALASEMNTP